MRLSEGRIRQGILHPDAEVREMAVQYFSASFTQDRTVMPMVVQAVETYGWKDAPSGYYLSNGLPLTEETVRWVIGELNRVDDDVDERWLNYTRMLSNLLVNCDAEMLRHCGGHIIEELDHLELDGREELTERFRLMSADTDACWNQLVEFCEREKDKRYVNEVNLGHAKRLVEAIARNGEEHSDRLLSILEEEVEEWIGSPMGWMEPLAVRLAGEMRLEPAVPLIVEKMHEDADLLSGECQRALAKIGTDSTIEAVAHDFVTAQWHFRLYACGVLEMVHSDLTVEKCLHLLQQEEDDDIRIQLARAALCHFADESIDPARQVVLNTPLDPELLELRRHLLRVTNLMEVDFPEREQWEEEAKDDAELGRKLWAEKYGIGAVQDDDDGPAYAHDEQHEEPVPPPHTIVREERTGRNSPCPCGSGKKYKKCCLKKQSGASLFD